LEAYLPVWVAQFLAGAGDASAHVKYPRPQVAVLVFSINGVKAHSPVGLKVVKEVAMGRTFRTVLLLLAKNPVAQTLTKESSHAELQPQNGGEAHQKPRLCMTRSLVGIEACYR